MDSCWVLLRVLTRERERAAAAAVGLMYPWRTLPLHVIVEFVFSMKNGLVVHTCCRQIVALEGQR